MLADIKCEQVLNTGRPDILVSMDNHPVLVVECKKPNKSFDHLRTNALAQAERYASELHINRILVTNGRAWILACGHQVVAEAKSPEEFIAGIGEFCRWINIRELWCSATGLVVPETDFEARRFIERAWNEESNDEDLRWAQKFRERIPFIGSRIEEEIYKSITIKRQYQRICEIGEPERFSVIHIDNTFAAYRAGAWSYDPLYHRHLWDEHSFIREARRLGISDSAVRVFITKRMTELEKSRLFKVSQKMINEGWTVMTVPESALKFNGIHPGDAIGSYYSSYSEDQAYSINLLKAARKANQLKGTVHDLFSVFPESIFRPNDRNSSQPLMEYINSIPTINL